MRLRLLLALVVSTLGSLVAQDRGAEATITAVLWHDSPNDRRALAGLTRGLRALGLAERLRVVEARGDADRLASLLDGLDDHRTALVVALGTEAARAARARLESTPVVFTAVTHPVLSGVADSWDGAGSRVAGNSNWLDRKEMLAVFRQAVPGLRRLAVMRSAGNRVSEAEVVEARRATEEEAPAVEISDHVVGASGALAATLDAALAGADALWLPIDFALYQPDAVALIVERANAARVPIVSTAQRWAGRGALVVLSVDYELLGLRAASLVRRVLIAGVDPGTIAVERLASHRVHVDVDAARAIGRPLPLELVFRAHQVIADETPR